MLRNTRRILTVLLLTFVLSAAFPASAFADDYTNNAWYSRDVTELVSAGVVTPDPLGNVYPKNPMTRGAFVSVVNKICGFTEEADENFADVPDGHPYAADFRIARRAGYIEGYAENGVVNAHPSATITRAEVAKILALNFRFDTSDTGTFNPSDVAAWAMPYVRALMVNYIMTGYPDGTFRGYDTITNAEGYALAARLMRTGAGAALTPATTATTPAPKVEPQTILIEPSAAQPSGTKRIEVDFHDPYKKEWKYVDYLSHEFYRSFKDVSHAQLTRDFGWGYYVNSQINNDIIPRIVKAVKAKAAEYNYGERDVINILINMAQSIRYEYDNVSSGYDEYPKFPYETLYDENGDCEDLAILIVALLREAGYDAILVEWPGHMAAAMVWPWDDARGWSFTGYNGKKYYYIESTAGEGYGIGNMPQELQNQKSSLIYFDQDKDYIVQHGLTILECLTDIEANVMDAPINELAAAKSRLQQISRQLESEQTVLNRYAGPNRKMNGHLRNVVYYALLYDRAYQSMLDAAIRYLQGNPYAESSIVFWKETADGYAEKMQEDFNIIMAYFNTINY